MICPHAGQAKTPSFTLADTELSQLSHFQDCRVPVRPSDIYSLRDDMELELSPENYVTGTVDEPQGGHLK